MTYVDGNAVGGMLALAFGTDMTLAEGTCTACGTTHPLATAHVYLRCPGAVLRCPNCDNVELVLVEVHGQVLVTLTGLRAIAGFDTPA